MDEILGMAQGLPPWSSPQGQGEGSTVVNEATGTAELSPPQMWSWDGGEGLSTWKKSQGQRKCHRRIRVRWTTYGLLWDGWRDRRR